MPTRHAGSSGRSVPAFLPVFLAVLLSSSDREANLATVLARHAEARGGAEAIASVASLSIDLEITEPDFTVSGQYVATRDGYMRIDIHAGDERVFSEALGPDGGWQMGADGIPVDLSPQGEEALRWSLVGNLYGLHELAALGVELRSMGLATRGGQKYWVVEKVAPDGSSAQVFLHAETYLVEREITTAALHPDVDPTETEQETLYTDHSATAGVLFANRTEKIDVASGEVLQTVVVEARRVNAPVDPSRFLRPSPGGATEYLHGHIERAGAVLPIRLALPAEGDGRLDIPQLWYAEEPIPASRTPDGLRLELPFGIGAVEMKGEDSGWSGSVDGFSVRLELGEPPPYTKHDVSFGDSSPPVDGTLYLPDRDAPSPAVILVGGAAAAGRGDWSYRSKADYYARLGVAALVYDRREGSREEDERAATFWTHAADLDAARRLLASRDDIRGEAIGLHAASQGVWLATIAQGEHAGGFAFLIFTGVPAVSPGEQQMHSLIHGMRDDGIAEEVIADAVAYQRLYLSVAHTGKGFDLLEAAIEAGRGTPWIDYVDQPRTLADLDWWHHHHAYEPRAHLTRITIPILAMTGEKDWVTPAIENLPKLEAYAARAGNEDLVTRIVAGADHRLERAPYTDAQGQWHWFEIASEARAAIPAFLSERLGYALASR